MIRKLTIQVLDYNDNIVFTKECLNACNSNCLESTAVGFSRQLKNYFNNPGKGGFEKIYGSGKEKPHTVITFFSDEPKITHYEDVEIDVIPKYVNEENIKKCIIEHSKSYNIEYNYDNMKTNLK